MLIIIITVIIRKMNELCVYINAFVNLVVINFIIITVLRLISIFPSIYVPHQYTALVGIHPKYTYNTRIPLVQFIHYTHAFEKRSIVSTRIYTVYHKQYTIHRLWLYGYQQLCICASNFQPGPDLGNGY